MPWIKCFYNYRIKKKYHEKTRNKKKFIKCKNHQNWCTFKSQRNFSVNFLRKARKKCIRNLNVKSINDNKSFDKTIKPLFNNNGCNSRKITLLNINAVLTNTNKFVKR